MSNAQVQSDSRRTFGSGGSEPFSRSAGAGHIGQSGPLLARRGGFVPPGGGLAAGHQDLQSLRLAVHPVKRCETTATAATVTTATTTIGRRVNRRWSLDKETPPGDGRLGRRQRQRGLRAASLPPRWPLGVEARRGRGTRPDRGGAAAAQLCVACVIEILEQTAVSVVRKKHALSCFCDVLTRFPSAVLELLAIDTRVCTHFIVTLLGTLQSVEDHITLDLVIEVLVSLVVELKSEQFVCCVFEECQNQLSQKNSMRRSLPVFTLLGKLLFSIPVLATKMIQEYGAILEHMQAGLVYPDEAVKASVCYIFCLLYNCPLVAEKLHTYISEKLCQLLLSVMESAETKELQINSLGLLKQLLQFRQFVTLIMSVFATKDLTTEDDSSSQGTSGSSLLLLLKKLLLSRDEMLQVVSVQCMTSILVHSQVQYAPALIYADIPEFLFERLSSTDEVLVWSLYSCLLLLTEEKLFFSKCQSVYGIESLVRSLKETLRLTNVEVQKQGLLLFGEILKRQPAGIKLFVNFTSWQGAIAMLQEGMDSPNMEVTTETANAVAAFLRKDHLAVPVQYQELQRLIEAMLTRCTDTSIPCLIRSKGSGNDSKGSQAGRREQNRSLSRKGQFLHSTLEAFHSACRLAIECQVDPSVQENAFTAPGTTSENTLEEFSKFLLATCDTLCIPVVMKYYDKAPSVTVMEVFFSILCAQYTLQPSMVKPLSVKLASSSFIRFTLELKAKFCTGARNPKLNGTCSDFLCRMCSILLSVTENAVNSQHGFNRISALLEKYVPQLNYMFSESIMVLSENSDLFGIDEDLRNSQYCILVILYLAHVYENRLDSEAPLFGAIGSFLHTALEQGDSPPPLILKAGLYLLSVCQDKGGALDPAQLNSICKHLEAVPSFSSVYHPQVLKFIFRYPQLTDKFGHSVLKCWFVHADISCFEDENQVADPHSDVSCVMNIVLSNPKLLIVLLDIVHTADMELAFKALLTLKEFLRDSNSMLPTSDLLRPRLLRILQRFTIENNTQSAKENQNLPLVLDLLSLIQIKNSDLEEMDTIDFKLLYHVSNLAGKCKALNPRSWSLHLISSTAFKAIAGFTLATRSVQFVELYMLLTPKFVSTLLSNCSLMELLEKILDLSWSEQVNPEPPSDTLICSGWLLTGSLIQNHANCGSEVHRTVGVNLDKLLHGISFRKKTSSLLQVCFLQFLQIFLRHNLESPLLTLTVSNTKRCPLQDQEAELYPSPTTRSSQFSSVCRIYWPSEIEYTQGDELLLYSAIGCLEALMQYLHKMSKVTASHLVSQPWSRFLIFTMLSSSENCINAGFLRLLTLFLKYCSKNIISESDVSHVLQMAGNLKVEELSSATAEALILFLNQLQSGKASCLDQKVKAITGSLLEKLQSRSSFPPDTRKIVFFGGLAVCLSDISSVATRR
ncbi:meiosis inhibitor protein 1 [Callorhinchus milii]|uniref:meiosis inhibitor protein 1 n=1 Tax=Callorhinchus milii TaxID=7868 RepID=UPI001C3FC54D|nr:meiosis inhibitor protein 1 [Callorhinchus milii]